MIYVTPFDKFAPFWGPHFYFWSDESYEELCRYILDATPLATWKIIRPSRQYKYAHLGVVSRFFWNTALKTGILVKKMEGC